MHWLRYEAVRGLRSFFFSSRRRHTRYWRDWSSDVCSSDLGNRGRCTVSYKEMAEDLKVGDTVLIDDGLVSLKVVEISANEIITRVENSGRVSSRKGVNLPGVEVKLPAITEKDREDIEFGIEQGIDFIAASFVRKAEIGRA